MSYSSEVLADSPLVYWKLAEASGTTVTDSSGNARDGAYTASPTLGQTGPLASSSDTAVLFNGTTQYGQIAYASWMNGFTELTIEAWVKTTATSGTAFGRSGNPCNYRLGVSTGKAFVEIRTTTTVLVAGTSTINDGNWHYICGRWTGSSLVIEVDGVQENSASAAGGLSGLTNVLRVGQRNSDSFFAGTVAQCALYGTNIGPTRMAAHYAARLAASTTISGGHVSETDTGRAGSRTVGARVSGGVAHETDAARAGALVTGQLISGGHVAETDTPHGGKPNLVVVGGTGHEADTGHVGAPAPKILGGHVSETDAAHAGVIQVVIPGGTAHETDTGHGQPSGSMVGGHVAEVTTIYSGSVVLGYGTTRRMRAGGRRRTGLATATWVPAVTAVPVPFDYGQAVDLAQAFTTPVMVGTQPTYTVTTSSLPRHRDRIVVGGVDVTFFRNIPTPPVQYQLVEPLTYGPATLDLPQVAAAFETPGTGDLSWLKPGKKVLVQRVDTETNEVVATDYRGIVIAFDTSGRNLTVEVGGESSGRAALRDWPIPIFRSVHDAGRWAFHAIHSLGLRFTPRLGPDTGIDLAKFGGTGHLDYIRELCAKAQDRDGTQWTINRTEDHGYKFQRKDTTTIDGTVYLDDARCVADLRRDVAEEPNVIYATGVTQEGMRWQGGEYPGLKQGEAAPYPFADHRTFGLGTQNADTDTGDGITVMISQLRVSRYIGAEDAPGGFDRDVVRAVKALQDDAGLSETGVMNVATWNALYNIGTTGASLRWSHIAPIAQKSYTRKWRKSASGTILGRNDNYDPSRLEVHRTVDMGAGVSQKQGREWSRAELDQSEDNWVGTITLHQGAVVAGDHTPGDPITAILRARDITTGMNLSLPLFAGGITVHVSAVSVAEQVTLTVDTRARDAMEVWEIIARNRESRRDPARMWERQHRASGQIKDALDEWSEVGGLLGSRVPLHGGRWNIVEVVAGQAGTVQKLALETNPNAEYAVAIFGREIAAETLDHAVGNPLTDGGKGQWTDEQVRERLDDRHLLLYAAGDKDAPCGYWPHQKQGDHPLTGAFKDAAGFSYYTYRYPVLYVAIYPDRNTSIPAGRVMWPQLEAGA